jgi:hypothetical protein
VDEENSFPQAMIPILTTEHFTLQSARSVIMAEIGSRATIYLSAVSASVVALAFVTTLSEAEELISGFVLVLLPVLVFMGFVTKARLVQLSYTDFHYQRAINRIRHFYVDIAPQTAHYLLLSTHDDLAGVAQSAVYQQGRRMGVLTAAQMIAVINYVITGLLGAVLLDWLLDIGPGRLLLAGAILGLSIGIVDAWLASNRWNRYVASLDVLFPTPAEEVLPDPSRPPTS